MLLLSVLWPATGLAQGVITSVICVLECGKVAADGSAASRHPAQADQVLELRAGTHAVVACVLACSAPCIDTQPAANMDFALDGAGRPPPVPQGTAHPPEKAESVPEPLRQRVKAMEGTGVACRGLWKMGTPDTQGGATG